MTNAGEAVGYLELDTSGFKSGITSAISQLNNFNDTSLSMDKRLASLSSSFVSAGSTLTKGITVPAALGAAAILKTGASFESAMSQVKAISSATADEMSMLKDVALEMGAKTKFSASESAEAFQYMASAGWSAAEMASGISGVMSLAAASGEELALTSNIVTGTLTAFGLQAKDSAHFADVLAMAANASNANVADLGASFEYAAPVAGALGYSIEDVTVALSAMANANIKGSTAGTTLRSMLTNLAKPTDDMAAAMDKYGISLTDDNGKMLELNEVIAKLRTVFAGLTESQKASLAATLAGKEGMSGLLAIVNASDEGFDSLTDKINNASGAAKTAADIMMDNLSGSIEQLKGTVETIALSFSDLLIPKFRALVDIVGGFADSLTKMSDTQKNLILTIVGIAAAVGPILIIIGKIIAIVPTLMAMGPAIAAIFTAITGPIGLTVIGIAAVIVAIKTLYEKNEQFRNQFNAIWDNISSGAVEKTTAIKAVFDKLVSGLQPAIDGLKEVFGKFSSTIGDSIIKVITNIQYAYTALEPLLSALMMVLGASLVPILGLVVGAVEGILSAIGPLIDAVGNIFKILGDIFGIIIAFFTGDFSKIGPLFKDMINEWIALFGNLFTAIVNLVTGIFKGYWDTVIGIFSSFGIDLVGIFTTIVDSIVQFFVNIADGFMGFVNSVIEFGVQVQNVFNNIPYYIGYAIGAIAAVFVGMLVALWNWITVDIPAWWASVVKWFSELPAAIAKWFDETVKKSKEFGKNLKESAIEAGKAFLDNVISFVQNLPANFSAWLDKTVEKVKGFGPMLKEAGINMMDSLFNGIKGQWDSIWKWFEGIGEDISNFFKGIGDGFAAVSASSTTVSGSHANGLSRVPYNGYVAQLHQDEMVLTKQEADTYKSGGTSGDTFNFYSPTKIDEYEAARQLKLAKKELDLQYD